MASVLDSRSIKHPNTFLIQTGRTQLSKEIESINQSIKLILSTSVGELWGDPEFGSYLYEYLYEYEGDNLTQTIRSEIVRALNRWESRILLDAQGVTVSYDRNTVIVNINYNIKYTNYTSSFRYITTKKEGNYGD